MPRKKKPERADWKLFGGGVSLEVVGEASYQDALTKLADTRADLIALLVPEPDNPYDSSAVAVFVMDDALDDPKVGYLPREVAAVYQDGVVSLIRQYRAIPALRARLVGGEPWKPHIGIWLDHDPVDFGIIEDSDN